MGGPAPPENADDQALHFLASEGYLPLALADHPAMMEAYSNLFAKSHEFFALPADSSQKTAYQAVSGPTASEEGYSKIEGEKSILTTRTSNRCPELLLSDLKTAWDLTGAFVERTIRAIAVTLDLKEDVFLPFVNPCTTLTESKTPTQLRMFRYERPPTGSQPTVNAEKHKDLGLLSLVIGHSPGLQVFDTGNNVWLPIEEDTCLPPDARIRSAGLTATLLGGETLAFLTRGKYKAGIHRVVCAPVGASHGNPDPFRFSIVYTLRPAPAPLYTKNFESEITGTFGVNEQCEGESSSVLFEKIMKSHWNINAARDVREKQRQEQAARRRAAAEKVGGEGKAHELTKPLSG